MSSNCKRRGAVLGSATGGALDVDAESDDFPRDRRLCRESESGRSSRHKVGGRMPAAPPTFLGDRLDGEHASTSRTHPSRWAPHGSGPSAGPLGRGESPDTSSRLVACDRRDDDTSAPWGGDDEDDPDMLLQSTAALATSPLHDGSGDGSSSEEMPSSLPSVSWCGCRCDRAWRFGVSCAAPCAQCASSPSQPVFG
jgi:hypothetical protein